MKLLCYAMLSGDLPEGEDRPAIETVSSNYYHLRYFCNWLDGAYPGLPISDLTEDHLASFVNHLFANVRSPTSRHKLRTAVAFLWRYRSALGVQGLSFDPRLRDYWFVESYPESGEENATPRIPEEVHGPLLVWAMRFVDVFSDDIIAATRNWARERGTTPVTDGRRHRIPWGRAAALVGDYLEESVRLGRALPGEDGVANRKALARKIGCSTAALERYTEQIASAAELVGVDPYQDLAVSPQGQLDGAPWITGVTLSSGRFDSLGTLSCSLQTACYIVIAFLSGMRDAEVKHLRVGCSNAVRDSFGRAVRWQVRSLAFKSERNARGVEATWVVGEPAARAIRVLERLLAASDSESDLLFAPLTTSGAKGSGGRSGNGALTVSGTILALNRFVEWVAKYCAVFSRADGIPDHDGRPWNLTTRQFRRTLAWYIARRPGGAIVGAIAYRHHSIQMFEGYAGTSDSGFRAEVEAEEALARGEHLLAMIEQHEHASLGGPGAKEAFLRLEEMGKSGHFAGTVQTDSKRFARLMKTHGPEVYPGEYVTCAFRSEKALCHVGEDGPDLHSCQPLACANVALTAKNVQRWERELTQIEADIEQRPALPPLLVSRLNHQREQIIRLLAKEGFQ